MIRIILSLLVFALIAGCSEADKERASLAEPAQDRLAGQDAYEKACAGCHEPGADGAPATGDPEAWSGRSSLWVAVLEEHAKEGYLDMPAQANGLTDEEISAAVAYMLTLTHPEQRPE